jgi:SAM-dependent methyltransferase
MTKMNWRILSFSLEGDESRSLRWRRARAVSLIAVLLSNLLPWVQVDARAGTNLVTSAAGAPAKKPDVVYVPSRQEIVEKMLEMAELKPNDILYDLGCGDGRIVVAAAKKYGVKAVGVDIDPQRVKESMENVRTNGVGDRVSIKQADIFELDFSDASVVTLNLLPELNVRLMPKLAKLKPGTRILSNDFEMKGARPLKIERLGTGFLGEDGDFQRTIYKWVVPWEPE